MKEVVVFLRVDNPELNEVVKSLEEKVTDKDLEVIQQKVIELNLNSDFGMGYEMCQIDSRLFNELSNDSRYFLKKYNQG
jgi:hypothetical protein